MPDSTMVVHGTVNAGVVGSSPTRAVEVTMGFWDKWTKKKIKKINKACHEQAAYIRKLEKKLKQRKKKDEL